jgi:WD40 repeat protein
LPGQRDKISSAVFTAAGRLATTGDDGTLVLWDLADPAHPRALGPPVAVPGAFKAQALARDAPRMAVRHAEEDTATIWDLADPARPRPLGPPFPVPHAAYGTALSPDGRTLALSSNYGEITVVDVGDPLRARTRGTVTSTGLPVAMDFSPDGRTLAVSSYAGALRLWDVRGGGPPAALGVIEQPGGVLDAAFSPDGATLATAGEDHNTQLWNVTDPTRPVAVPPALAGHAGRVHSVAFSPDGRTIATSSVTDGVRLWAATPAYQPRPRGAPFPAGPEAVRSIAATPERPGLLVAVDSEGALTTWDVTDAAAPRVTFHDAIGARSVALSRDGRTLAVAGAEVAAVLDVTGPPPRSLGPPLAQGDQFVNDVELSADGRVLVMSSLQLFRSSVWDVSDPGAARQIGGRLGIDTYGGEAIAFRGDGQVLAAGGPDNTVLLWDMADPAVPRKLGPALTGHSSPVVALALSPDGHTLATGSSDNSVILWDATDPGAPRRLGLPLDELEGGVNDIAFSPDGQLLAAAVGGEGALLFDVRDPAHPHQLGEAAALPGSAKPAAIAFVSGGTLAAGNTDGSVVLWDVDGLNRLRNAPREAACALVGRGLDPAEWALEAPGLDYRETCPP